MMASAKVLAERKKTALQNNLSSNMFSDDYNNTQRNTEKLSEDSLGPLNMSTEGYSNRRRNTEKLSPRTFDSSIMSSERYHYKRRNTEKLPPGSLDPGRCRQNNHSYQATLKTQEDDCSCSKRRHTLVSGVTSKELFEMETKLIFLEFLKTTTPRFKIDRFKKLNPHSVPVINQGREVEKSPDSETPENVKEADGNDSRTRKRDAKKQRKVSGNKSKTVTLGENERKEARKLQNSKVKYQRSSSDLTSKQYLMMKKKFEEMQLPIIQWLKEHVVEEKEEDENDIVLPAITTTIVERGESETESENYQQEEDPRSTLRPRPRGLTINIPRRSIALQLVESNIFTPQTIAVQKLDRISEEIMRDYGDVLEASMKDLLNPIRATNSLTYAIFSSVADKVYNFATKSTVARLAMLLNLVKETMVEGNLNEEQLELLVEYSAKFFTENAPESPLLEGNGWVDFKMNGSDKTFFDCSSDSSSSSSDGETDVSAENFLDDKGTDENNWAPYGMAALTVGIGLAYTCLKS